MNASADIGLYFTRKPEHPVLRQRVLGQTELVYCAAPEDPIPGIGAVNVQAQALPRRRVMLALQGTTLRLEQERLMEGLYEHAPDVVCEAEIPLLRTLAQAGGADAVMPRNMLSEQAAARSLPLEPRQTMYLVLAVNPSRNLPQPAQALEEQIETAFGGFM